MVNQGGLQVRIPSGDAEIEVRLYGEFDVHRLESLRRILSSMLGLGRPVFMDLSGVTFLDVLCARELAAQVRLHRNRLALCNPSWQVETSVATVIRRTRCALTTARIGL